MNELLNLAAALIVGLIGGAFFFGGLWWTVQKGTNRNNPLIFLASFAVRMMAVGAITLAFRSDWKALLVLLAGFIAARGFVIAKISDRVRRL